MFWSLHSQGKPLWNDGRILCELCPVEQVQGWQGSSTVTGRIGAMHGLLLDNIHDSQKGNTLIATKLLVPSFFAASLKGPQPSGFSIALQRKVGCWGWSRSDLYAKGWSCQQRWAWSRPRLEKSSRIFWIGGFNSAVFCFWVGHVSVNSGDRKLSQRKVVCFVSHPLGHLDSI